MHREAVLSPVRGHMHVFTPSPFGKATNGVQRSVCEGGKAQAILVHRASLLRPLAPQVQVLQPSSAVYDILGQHVSPAPPSPPSPPSLPSPSPLPSPGSTSSPGHAKLVQ